MNKTNILIKFVLLYCALNATATRASSNKRASLIKSKANDRTNKKFREKIGHADQTDHLETLVKKLSMGNEASTSVPNETTPEKTADFKNNEVSTWKKVAKKYPELFSQEAGYYAEEQLIMEYDEKGEEGQLVLLGNRSVYDKEDQLVMQYDENGEENQMILLEGKMREHVSENIGRSKEPIEEKTLLTPYQRYVTSPRVVWNDLIHVLKAFEGYWPVAESDDEIVERNALAMWRIYHISSKYEEHMKLVATENSKQRKIRGTRIRVCKKKTGNHDLANEICQIIRNIFFWDGKREVSCVEAIVDNNVKWGPQLVALCRLEWPETGLMKFGNDPFMAVTMDVRNRGPDVTLAILDGSVPDWYFIGAVHTEKEPYRVKIINEVKYNRKSINVKMRFAPSLGTMRTEIMRDLQNPERAIMIPREFCDRKIAASHKILDWKMLGGKGDPFDPKTGAFADYLKTNEEIIKTKNEMYNIFRDKNISRIN